MNSKKKNILIINAHPDNESFNFSLARAYQSGVEKIGADIQVITLRDLKFNPNLQFGYRKRTDQEPDLEEAWKKIQWADHLVFIYPIWWGSAPALLKGFIDRVFCQASHSKKEIIQYGGIKCLLENRLALFARWISPIGITA